MLDGLRGVAILLVFANHVIARPLEPATGLLDVAVRTIAYAGWTGVDLFFVLSGFLITGILLDTKGEPGWWWNFAARRALRIFPVYYGALTVLFVLLPRIVRWPDAEFAVLQANQAWYWTYTVNLLAGLTHAEGTRLYTAHFWSLSIEEQFYLFWPLVVWACKPRTLVWVCACAVAGGLGFRLGLVLHDPVDPLAAYVLTPGRLDALAIGAALAVAARTPYAFARLRAMAPRALGAGALALVGLAAWRGGLNVRDPVIVVAAFPLVAVVFGAVLVIALTAPPGSRINRIGCSGALRKWGRYSYGIYVVHFPLLGAIEWKTTFYQHQATALGGSRLPAVVLFAAVVMTLSYALGVLSYHLYEKHFLALKRLFTRTPRPMIQLAASS